MNLTIAIRPADSSSASGAEAIAPASGADGAILPFSLHLPELAIDGLTGETAGAALPGNVLADPAIPALAAIPGNALPHASGNGLPVLPLSLPQSFLGTAQSAPPPIAAPPGDGAPRATADLPTIGPTQLSLPGTPQVDAKTAAEGVAAVRPALAGATPPPLEISIAVKAEPAPPVTAAFSPASQTADPHNQRGDAAAMRLAGAAPAESGPAGNDQAPPHSGDDRRGGLDSRAEGKPGKSFAAPAPAADRAAGTAAPATTPAAPAMQAIAQPASPPANDAAAPGLRAAASETRPQEFETIVQRLAEARETARPASADITLLHREFGNVALQMEVAGRQLRVALASQDPGFAPAVQAALAERGGLPGIDLSRSDGAAARGDNAPGGNGAGAQSSAPGHNGPAANPGQHRDGNPAQTPREGSHVPRSIPAAEARNSAHDRPGRDTGLFA